MSTPTRNPAVSGRRTRTRPDQGQILVIFTGGLLVLLGIAALVVDLGFVFMIRRMEQNIADPAAIAAARYIKDPGGKAAMDQVACFYARENGLFRDATSDSGCVPANDAYGTTLTVNFPPGPGAGTFAGRSGFVEVVISREHNTFIGGAIGLANIRVTSSAVAAFSDGDSNSSSLVALNPSNKCATGKIHGTGDVLIHPVVPGTDGGYVHVNSTCGASTPDGVCASGNGGLKIDGTGTLVTPHAYVAGTCQDASGGGMTGDLTEGSVQIGDPLGELAAPDPSDYPAGRCGPMGPVSTPTSTGCRFNTAGTIHLNPGVYYNGWDIRNNVTLELGPGVYVIAGGGIKLNAGGSITSVQGGLGAPAPVLIFNTDNPVSHAGQSDVDFTAQSTLKLRAIDTGPYRGILLWNDADGSNPDAEVTLGGQVSLDIAGTVYNPMGLVKVEGGSGVGSTAAVQIIAWEFDIGGNATLDMPYDPNQLYRFENKGLVR